MNTQKGDKKTPQAARGGTGFECRLYSFGTGECATEEGKND
jgi:hypothetical protein